MLKMKELPGMPPKTDLENACEDYLKTKGEISEKKDKLSVIAGRIVDLLKEEGRSDVKFMGYYFSLEDLGVKLFCKEI